MRAIQTPVEGEGPMGCRVAGGSAPRGTIATLNDELPAFGCAVSRSLQDLLDPLGIKYKD